jgi:very-short-patch-repair endonuclease
MSKTELFISKAIKIHKDRYDYSKVKYINAKTKILITCKIHGEFEQTPSNHLSNFNCQKCANNLKSTNINFIEKALLVHHNRYDYSKVCYINADIPVIIICKEHGEFKQIPDFHINRSCGCPSCNNKTENICFSNIKKIYPTIIKQFKVNWCKHKKYLPFDFCIPELFIIIELDGPQHFKQISNWVSPEIQLENDKYKIRCANDNKYSVIRILQEDVYYNKYNWVDELLQNIQRIIDEKYIQNIYMCKNNEYILYIT